MLSILAAYLPPVFHRTILRCAAGVCVEGRAPVDTSVPAAVDAVPVAVVPEAVDAVPVAGTVVAAAPSD